jgi:1,4-alpha-glucan branching enzyme
MIRKDGGQWEVSMQLKPGKYQYKFVADDQWLVDPKASENVPNSHGSQNSVREVKN